MSELAFTVNGDTFEVPYTVTAWRVRRLKPRGAPELVYARDGRPLTLPIEADLDDLHEAVTTSGKYRLDPVGDDVERLFTNTLDPAADPSFAAVAGLRVSAHFFIRRGGDLVQFVSCNERAWHAGVSAWRGRQRCNDFSIGIELEGTDDTAYADAQYQRLAVLLRALKRRNPELLIGVMGCMAQLQQEAVLRRAPQVDLVFGSPAIARAVSPAISRARLERSPPAISASASMPSIAERVESQSKAIVP